MNKVGNEALRNVETESDLAGDIGYTEIALKLQLVTSTLHVTEMSYWPAHSKLPITATACSSYVLGFPATCCVFACNLDPGNIPPRPNGTDNGAQISLLIKWTHHLRHLCLFRSLLTFSILDTVMVYTLKCWPGSCQSHHVRHACTELHTQLIWVEDAHKDTHMETDKTRTRTRRRTQTQIHTRKWRHHHSK